MPDSADSSSHQPRGDARRRSGMIGVLIGLVGLVFAAYALINAKDALSTATLTRPGIVAAGILGLVGMTVIGLNWIRIIHILGQLPIPYRGLQWYFVGQLGKYIPGGVWAVLGRGELANRGGILRPTAYASVVISLITTYAAAASTGAIFLSFGTAAPSERLGWAMLSLAIVGASAIGVSQPVVSRINGLAKRFGKEIALPSASIKTSLSAIALTVPAWVAIGSATVVVGRALGYSSSSASQIVAATCYSWLAGFLVIPLPGGLGVREAVFMTLYSGPTEEAAAVAVVARVVFVVVDLTGAGVSTLVTRIAKVSSATR